MCNTHAVHFQRKIGASSFLATPSLHALVPVALSTQEQSLFQVSENQARTTSGSSCFSVPRCRWSPQSRQRGRLNICCYIGWIDKYSICQFNQYIFKYWRRWWCLLIVKLKELKVTSDKTFLRTRLVWWHWVPGCPWQHRTGWKESQVPSCHAIKDIGWKES